MEKNIVVVDEDFKHLFKSEKYSCYSPLEYILESDSKSSVRSKVYNLSSEIGYQELGYYVSLLAMARKEKIYPTPRTIQDFKDKRIQKLYSQDVYDLIQKKLDHLEGENFELSIYFGANITSKYDKLAWELYRMIQAPMFKVLFKRTQYKDERKWQVSKISLVELENLNQTHLDFLVNRVEEYFSEEKSVSQNRKKYYYDLAILHNKEDDAAPSDEKALQNFVEAFKKVGIKAHFIQYKDKPNISEYDALFIRETTNVSHHTYRLARNAEKEGLVVIDDPDSIVKCSNKIFLEQLMENLNIKRPKSLILDKSRFAKKCKELTFPCIVKKPDSAFSQGVYKAKNLEELNKLAQNLFQKTHLILIQEYLPTEFDWRIGILNGEVIFACKYYMAEGHWQIINNNCEKGEKPDLGKFECIDPKLVDETVLKTAIKACKPIGKGLYGVDLKQKGKDVYLIEVNDNPNIESEVEDLFLGKELYLKIANHFLNECNKKRGFFVSQNGISDQKIKGAAATAQRSSIEKSHEMDCSSSC